MAKCRHCGSEDVAWGVGAKGQAVLMDTKPRPHIASCKERQAKRKAVRETPRAVVYAYLRGQFGEAEATELLRGCRSKDEEGLMREALAKRNAPTVGKASEGGSPSAS